MADEFLSEASAIEPIPDSVPREDIRKEGDFFLQKAEIITFDGKVYGIELIRTEISIYEDLFNHTTTGIVTFADASDLPQILPLIGEERFKLTFTRPDESGRGLLDESYEMEFRIYKMADRGPDKERLNIQQYTLHFASPDTITNIKKKVWQAYKDMPYSDMVVKIFDEYIGSAKPLVVEPTLYDQKYTAAGLTPFQTIAVLASKSISEEGNGSAYIFYEDMEKYNFITLGKLMKQDSAQKYISELSNVLKDQQKNNRDRLIDRDVRRADNYTFPGSFDILANMHKGMYSQRLVAVDILRQLKTDNDWSYKDEFPGLPHVRDADVCTDALDALGEPVTIMKLALTTKDHDIVPWIAAREPGIRPNKVEEYLLKRASQMQQAGGNKLLINVSGDPRRRVGQAVEFLVPNHYGTITEEKRPDPPFDRYLGGKFVITALKHSIRVDRYFMQMELMTDTLSQEIEGVDIIDFQKFSW